MNSSALRSKPTARNHQIGGIDIEKQIRRGKAVLRELKAALEDLEDRRALAAAKKRNAGKPGTPLRDAAKELEL
jgi:hypothetical protein